jgi:hypothetical protein
MYAGLRVGEACAVTPSKLEGNYLDVNEAYSQDGLHLGSPKTYGKILTGGKSDDFLVMVTFTHGQ